jgi:hypothetical protein
LLIILHQMPIMRLLFIFQNTDGTLAWDYLSITLLALIAGWFLHRYNAKRKIDLHHKEAMAVSENRYKRLENEYKVYKGNILTADKHNEKALQELNARVKALEGDIRALAVEKNKEHHLLSEKDQEIRRLMDQLGVKDDAIKAEKEEKLRSEDKWAEKLRTTTQSLNQALHWEEKAKNAQIEAGRIKDAMAFAERKKLEAELRLKATLEYAGKIGPLEDELAAKDRMIKELQEQIGKGPIFNQI